MVAACDLLLAAPSSSNEVLHSGTWATIRHARKLGKRIVLILPDGVIEDSTQTSAGMAMAPNNAEEMIRRKRAMIAEARRLVDELPDDEAVETIPAIVVNDKQKKPKHDPFDRWEEYLLENEDLKTGEKRQLTLLFKPDSCDLCGSAFSERRFVIDGPLSWTRMGAHMCASCFLAKGTEIEWGEGQLYTQMEDATWLLTGGFPPEDRD